MEDLSIQLSPAKCDYLGAVHEVRAQEDLAEYNKQLPRHQEHPWTVEEIRNHWGESAPALSTLHEKLNGLVNQGKVDRSGTGRKGDPYRYRQAMIPPFVQTTKNQKNRGITPIVNEGLAIRDGASNTIYSPGTVVRFDGGLGRIETARIESLTDWPVYPGETCYRVSGGRNIPHSRVLGVEGAP